MSISHPTVPPLMTTLPAQRSAVPDELEIAEMLWDTARDHLPEPERTYIETQLNAGSAMHVIVRSLQVLTNNDVAVAKTLRNALDSYIHVAFPQGRSAMLSASEIQMRFLAAELRVV